MVKKLLFALLGITLGAQAVLLKNGSSVSQEKINHVYSALKSLKNTPEWMLLADLQRSCNGMPKQLQLGCYARNIHEKINVKERLKRAVTLGLCNKDGIIDEETAHIILSSVHWVFKGCVPLLISVKSPVSWWAWTEVFKKPFVK